MNIVGRVSLSAAGGLLGIAVMLGWADRRAPVDGNAVQQISAATAYFDSTIVLARGAQPRGVRGDELTVALGYLERLREGVGSPFRLADEAMRDPRLGVAMSGRVAWGLLGRLQRGDAYVIDATVLDGAGPWDAGGHGATGAAHVALIEDAIGAASDPRAGELAVRLAYMIESARGAVAPQAASVASEVAALVRDRTLARADLRGMLTGGRPDEASVLSLVREGRTSRSFGVELPALAPLGAPLQMEAMAAVPALVRRLDTLDRAGNGSLRAQASAPVIGQRFAARLRVLGAARPPVPQVLVTLRTRSRVPLGATNEETLAGAFAAAAAEPRADSARRALSLALLATAVAVRSLSQEEPWFPGDAGPDKSDLISEFSLAGVSFARGVPAAWEPYYLRELQTALRDMETVFPVLSFDGLHVRFGTDALRDSALAMHDPRDRTLSLPIATAGGTIAHELSHDLDWQTARRLFADGTGYSTDRAIRDHRGPLASSLRGMADARPMRAYSGASSIDRPAELFARGADWLVASVLARQGRVNGYLSAIEDGVLAGYAAGPPSALGTAGTEALVAAVDAMTYLPDSTRRDFEAQWADPAGIDPALLVRRVLDAPVLWRGVSLWSRDGGIVLAALPPAPCSGAASPMEKARESLLMLAVDARARGVAARRARYRPGSMRPGLAQSVLGGPPWATADGDRVVASLKASIAQQLGSALADQGVVPVVPAIFRSSASSCSIIAR